MPHTADIFCVPANARWSVIAAVAHTFEIDQTLFDLLQNETNRARLCATLRLVA